MVPPPRRRARRIFRLALWPRTPFSLAVLGAFLNTLGILLGALAGLAWRSPLSGRAQNYCKSALGAFTAFCGLQLLWMSLNGNLTSILKQFFLAVLAVVLGNLIGKILGLQKISNRLGRHASLLLVAAAKNPPGTSANGFIAATILFSSAPLAFIGSATDGLANYFFPLAVKGVMDGLAMMSFVKMFRWPVAFAAVPVFFFLNGLSLMVQLGARPWLEAHSLVNSVNAAAGLVVCATALVVLEVRRVELANYLPALAVAPLLTWLLAR